jgi:putative peptidoglycan lipid II flippase
MATAMIVVGSATLLVKLVAVAKEMVVAARLGTGPAVDAFALAYRLPAWGESVVALAFASALVPAWITAREKRGEAAAARLLGQAVTVLLLGLMAMTALLAVAAVVALPLMGKALDGERLVLARSAVLLLLPFLIPIGLYHCFAAVLNAGERFAVAALAPLLMPIGVMVAVMLLPPSQGASALAIGTVAGAVLQAAVLALVLRGKGRGLRPRWPVFSDPDLHEVLDRLGPLMIAHAIFGTGPLIDHAMAASLGAGSNAALEFGLRVPTALAGLGTVAVGAAILPYFSVMAAREDWAALRRSLDRWVLLLLVAAAPVVVVLAGCATPLTRLLFQRGAFSSTDTAAVAPVLAAGALQFAPYVLSVLLTRILIAIGGQRIVLMLAAWLACVNVLANWLLMRWMGVAGIALSTAIVHALYCATTWLAIRWLARAR